jgi:hypothetical protein
MRYRGKHARLFGLKGVKACVEAGEVSTAIRFFELDDLAEQTADIGAFGEALRLLLRYGKPGHRKAIIVLSDGRDGYLDDEEKCRSAYRRSKLCRAAKGWKARKECVQDLLNKRATELQTQFRDRAGQWLALLRAEGIRVFAVAYGMKQSNGRYLSHDYERERLELLAQKTGGTYREVTSTTSVEPAAVAIARELMNERVITVDAGLVQHSEYKLQLVAMVKIGAAASLPLKSVIVPFATETIQSGAGHWLNTKAAWLKAKVGTVLFWVIVVIGAIVLLFLLWMLFKLLKGIGKGIFKVFKKIFKLGKKAARAGGGR